MEQTKPHDQSRKETENFNSSMANSAITGSKEQKIDKAKIQLKILNDYITKSVTEHRKRSGGGFSTNKGGNKE